MLALRRGLGLGLLLPLCLCSCASFGFQKQAIAVALDRESDLLELRLLYIGVHGGKTALEVVRADANGKQHFILWDWPLDFDLDKIREIDAEEVVNEEHVELTRRCVTFFGAIEVSDARLLLDEEGRLCLFQKVRVPDVRAGIRLLNEGLSAMVLEIEADGQLAGELGESEARERMLAFVAAGEDFVSLNDDSLVVRLPGSRAFAARVLRELLGYRSREQDTAVLAATALDFLQELSMDEGVLTLTFGPIEGVPPILFLEDPGRTWTPAILEALGEETVETLSGEEIEELLAGTARKDR